MYTLPVSRYGPMKLAVAMAATKEAEAPSATDMKMAEPYLTST